ncbi:Hypp8418 [Branchiostoma lanceolatum]|uniref:Hypp8418 protein n=1 Tax=Branchiostoma lanceolatum TaxID=7740 RepID=A0A8K0EFB9_BRALA|nr:Hypp8418 [Branchiostoma lanceolatum]
MYDLSCKPVDSNTLAKLCEDVLNRVGVSEEEQRSFEEKTRQQSASSLWRDLRKDRLTASMFGELCKRRRTTPCNRILTDLLYKGPVSSESMRWGRLHEADAIEAYQQKTGHKVSPCGLIISKEHGFLAATPDGKVEQANGETGLLEVKCPWSAVNKRPQPLSPQEAAKQVKAFPLKEVNGVLHLPNTHNYYYQIQGQLNIAKVEWADFAVWTPAGLHIERISRDKTFWDNTMYPNLKWFYFNCMLPELACPRYPHMPIREPPEVVDATAKKQSGKVG